MRCQYTLGRKAKIKKIATNLTIPSAGENEEQWGLSLTAGGDAKWCGHFGRQFLIMSNVH